MQGAAIRRRKQMANGYRHLPPLKRPHYASYTAERSAKKMARLQELQKRQSRQKKG